MLRGTNKRVLSGVMCGRQRRGGVIIMVTVIIIIMVSVMSLQCYHYCQSSSCPVSCHRGRTSSSSSGCIGPHQYHLFIVLLLYHHQPVRSTVGCLPLCIMCIVCVFLASDTRETERKVQHSVFVSRSRLLGNHQPWMGLVPQGETTVAHRHRTLPSPVRPKPQTPEDRVNIREYKQFSNTHLMTYI